MSELISAEAINLELISKKLAVVHRWNQYEIDLGVRYYKNFLFLMRKYGCDCVLAPTEDIDFIWHQHILDTKKYHEDCYNFFGYYLHHYPYAGLEFSSVPRSELLHAFQTTQRLHKLEFGCEIKNVKFRFNLITNLFKQTLISLTSRKRELL